MPYTLSTLAPSRLAEIISSQKEIAIAGLDLELLMRTVAQRTQDLTGATGAVLELVEGEEMVYHSVSGSASHQLGLRLNRETSLSGKCVALDEILICNDSETDDRVDREACRKVGARSMIVVPLRSTIKPIGVLKVLSREVSAFGDQEVETLKLMAGLVSAAMDHAAQFQARERLMEALSEARIEADRANRLKTEFLANMSHELRTPLNGIIGFTELVESGDLGAVTNEQRDALGTVLQSARHLLQLLDDILDLSKVEAGKMTLSAEPVSPLQLTQEVLGILRPLAVEKQISVSLAAQVEKSYMLDGRKFKQILYNLLSNAIKFTAAAGTISLALFEEAGMLVLHVADNGIGIRAEDIPQLFQPFHQLDGSTTRKYGGTGLGLALTKKLVDLHGGEINVTSEPGKGSTFVVRLPSA